MVKGWRDNRGELHEKVYNVALSDERVVNKDGTAEPVGSTVDVRTATYTNSIGDAELATVWRDPDFSTDEFDVAALSEECAETAGWTICMN